MKALRALVVKLGKFKCRLGTKKFQEGLIIIILLAASGLAHGYNMFNFPYYENDEGTYLSQAWSLLKKGELAPYTYWYDHTPAGWILLSLWVEATGGFFTFGPAINTGRVFMLVLHLATVVLVFYITKRLSDSLFPSLITILIFSFSPLAIYFQRRVLLDNIMIFWVLASWAMIIKKNFKLSNGVLSAIFFGLAVLTKEMAILLLPALAYGIYERVRRLHNKSFAVIQWLSVTFFVISTYILYALLRGEFFPAGFLGDQTPHVSLLSSLAFQFSRGQGLPFWNPESDFLFSLRDWLGKDAFTVIIGAAGTIVGAVLALKVKKLRVPAFLALLFWGFLIRGDLIINFYVLPAIPLLAINLGLLLEFLFSRLKKPLPGLLKGLSLAIIVTGILTAPLNPYTRNETAPQIEAIEWIKNNLPSQTHIIIDNYAFIDLREERYPGDKTFPNADWFWKLDYDPAVREEKYNYDWRKIEYIALSHEMVKQMRFGTQKILRLAFDSSQPIKEWHQQSIAYLDLKEFISTNGDWMSILKINSPEEIALRQSWASFKENFIVNYGQVVDRANNDLTTSEQQADTMLRAVWENDHQSFDNVWRWTKDHLRYRQNDKLLSSSWGKTGSSENEYQLKDWDSSSGADTDAALALAFASKQWGKEEYLTEVREMIVDIWEKEVVEIAGRYYLISGSEKKEKEGYLVNPSYYSPAAYKIFAEIDPDRPWLQLANDSYYFLNRLSRQSSANLPPNWVLVNEQNGRISPAQKYLDNEADYYGYEAAQTFWRVALDAYWFNSPQALNYLKEADSFFRQTWRKEKLFAALYDTAGRPRTSQSSLSTDVGAFSVFCLTDQTLSKEIFDQYIEKQFHTGSGNWGNSKDYLDQSWGWFGAALYSQKLPNLWQQEN